MAEAGVGRRHAAVGPNYKWVALSNTTVGILLASLNATSLIIALPVVFRGIGINPLNANNFDYLLWVLMGYMLVSAVVVVTVGRIGDMFGRVRIYNLGFAVFTLGAILSASIWSRGSNGALELILIRMFQAIGGAMLMANSAAILTDAFPSKQLGLALGTNMIAAIAGSFLGILAGGLLSQIGWRWVFLANVPIGVFGTVWAYFQLREIGLHARAKIDWLGNATFAIGLGLILVGITYGIKPYGQSLTGWANPFVIVTIVVGVAFLIAFAVVETRVQDPMFHMALFKIRPFAAGNLAQFLGAVGRGGLQFMLIIWFQGIWLPQHGYAFTDTPLWAGIYMVPWMAGFVLIGPLSGTLSDRYGARSFATGGMLLSALCYGLLILFPANFSYLPFAAVIFCSGLGMGLFAAPNTASIMNSVPAQHRGAASGMRVTFANAGMPLSMGLFFTLMVLGLNANVPHAMFVGLTHNGVPAGVAAQVERVPPLGYLFAAFLGYNPLKAILGPQVLSHLPAGKAAYLTGRAFFPPLIGPGFKDGLTLILVFALVMSLVAAAASALRGGRYVYAERETVKTGSRDGAAALATPTGASFGDGRAGADTPSRGGSGISRP